MHAWVNITVRNKGGLKVKIEVEIFCIGEGCLEKKNNSLGVRGQEEYKKNNVEE